jgi:hypothetical protein
MKLIKLIEAPLKDWNKDLSKSPVGEMRIKEPSEFDLEKAIANCNINELDTLVVYR